MKQKDGFTVQLLKIKYFKRKQFVKKNMILLLKVEKIKFKIIKTKSKKKKKMKQII